MKYSVSNAAAAKREFISSGRALWLEVRWQLASKNQKINAFKEVDQSWEVSFIAPVKQASSAKPKNVHPKEFHSEEDWTILSNELVND